MKLKKVLLGGGAVAVALVLMPLFSAFEAHVINVTAQIENALSVNQKALDFGTVFPQEHLDLPLQIALSESFRAEDRVDDVDYFIRQKPKCAITSSDGQVFDPANTKTGHVVIGDNASTTEVVEEYWVDCGPAPRPLETGESWGVLPSLCEYISKEDDQSPDNDGSTLSFHHPWTISSSTTIDWLDTLGRLAKSEQDFEDNWTIDLAVPCFGGSCAQDWADFVHSVNPDANPDEFTQPLENEHKIFGCDLWVEVLGVSTSTEISTLTVIKDVINNNEGTGTTTDFSFMVDGGGAIPFEADGTNVVPATAGAHTVAEPAVAGYTATISGDCDGSGNVVVPPGGNATCTITNDDNEPEVGTLVVTKVVVNDDGGNNVIGDFALTVSGTSVNSGDANQFAPGAYDVNETGVAGYEATFSGDCDADGDVVIAASATSTCTITNDDISPNITLTKVVVNDDEGTAVIGDFTMTIDGTPVPSGSSLLVTANAAHTIDETGPAGYTGSISGDPECPGALGGTATLSEGEAISCTITNDDNPS